MTPLPPVPTPAAPMRSGHDRATAPHDGAGFADVLASVERATQAGGSSGDHVPAERTAPAAREAAGRDETAPGTPPTAAADDPAEPADTVAVAAEPTAAAEPMIIPPVVQPTVAVDPALTGGSSPADEGQAVEGQLTESELVEGPLVEGQLDDVGAVEDVAVDEVPVGEESIGEPAPPGAPVVEDGVATGLPATEVGEELVAEGPTAVQTGPIPSAGIGGPPTAGASAATTSPQTTAPVEDPAATAGGSPTAAADAPELTPSIPLTADGEVPAEPTSQPVQGGEGAPVPTADGDDGALATAPTGADAGPQVDVSAATDLPKAVSTAGPTGSDSGQDQTPRVTFAAGGPLGATPSAQPAAARPVAGMPAFATAQAMATPASQVASAVAALHRGADGVHEVSLEMHPAELGRVNVEVEVRAGVVNLRLSAEHDATRSLLNARLDDLRAALEQGGLQSGSMELSQHAFGRDGRDGDSGSRATSTGLPGGPASTATTVISAPRQHHTATSVDLLV